MGGRKKPTPKQRQIAAKRGMLVVKACPGSGKTFAVAARLAHLLREWPYAHRGIATISFTNVAWQEIARALSADFGVQVPIGYPHFLGTIDSFVNQHIFLPFGHLVMLCNRRPELIGPPANSWEPIGNPYAWGNGECYKRKCKLNQFSYDLSGNLVNVVKSRSGVFRGCPINHARCSALKGRVVKAGYATQRDAVYFGIRVLEEYPAVARAFVSRFPFLMMDEAQDTSAIEMRLVELLTKSGLKEVMLIGDPEQAIFEWRDAQPDLLESKYTEWEANSLLLEENWRSSQRICDFFHRISGLPHAPKAISREVAQFPADPAIWTYTEGGLEALVETFTNFCETKGVPVQKDTVAVLARSNDLVKGILGRRQRGQVGEPWRDTNVLITKSLCEARWRFDNKECRKAMTVLAKAVCAKEAQLDYCSEDDLKLFVDEYGYVKWRRELYELLTLLPTTNRALGDWIQQANKALRKNWAAKLGELAIKGGRSRHTYAQTNIDAMFTPSDMAVHSRPYRVGSIHSVKGETIDGVLVVLKEHAGDRRRYGLMLNERLTTNEELRIVYVGMTRARRILVLAVPEASSDAWQRKFSGS